MTQSVDSVDMMLPNKALNKEKHELETLLKHNDFSEPYAYNLLRERLEKLVSALHFSSQNRWGLQSDSQEIRALSQKFLFWMSQNQGMQRLQTNSTQAPFSLDIFLSREWLRFADETLKKAPQNKEPSYSAKRTLLELPLPANQLSHQVSGQVMDTFASLTQHLPEECRLVYQLHLEGLLSHEVALVCEIPESKVLEKIAAAKKWIQNPDEWRIAS